MAGSSGGRGRMRRLTSRQIAIIRILMKAGPDPITIRSIADQLEVSSRTILRELPDIERWFRENGIHFIRKPSVGLSIQEDTDTLSLLHQLLEQEPVQRTYSRRERRRQILGELLLAKEPIKSYVFQNRFQISEGTLSSDLDALSDWLATYQIKMIRRPGVGLLLEGSETAYRQAIAGAAFEFLDEGEILHLLRSTERIPVPPLTASPSTVSPSPTTSPLVTSSLSPSPLTTVSLSRDPLFGFIEPQIVTFVERILRETEQKLDIQYADSGYMALVVHLSLAIHRLQMSERIELDPNELAALSVLPEYEVAQQIATRIGDQFQLTIPPEETGFITMHLRSARIWKKGHRAENLLQSINTQQLVMAVVASVERQVGLPFHTCTRMIADLISHMDSLVHRLVVNQPLDIVQNATQTEMLQQKYPDIYYAVAQTESILQKRLMLRRFPPSEITFVAMHFAAAAELLRAEQKRVAVAVVCPSGMGASRMLAANLTRSFADIEVRQVASAFHLEPEKLRESGIDLVISTVPLQIAFPSLCVSPIPQEADRNAITRAVESINTMRQSKMTNNKTVSAATPPMTRSSLRSLVRTGEEINELLDHFTFRTLSGHYQVEDLIGQAASVFATSMASRQMIGADLAGREAIQSTFLPDLSIYLLHCRTAAISHCRFGYLHLQQPICFAKGTVKGAIILLAPKVQKPEGDDENTTEYTEVISQLSMLLVEDKRFLQALQQGDEKEGKAIAEQMLVKYFEHEITKKMGERFL